MPLNNLQDLYLEQLQDLYSAEQQILEALPQMAQKASNPELKQGFEQHLQQTQQQVQRLEQILQDLGEQPGGHQCKGMAGLIAEGQELMREQAAPEVADAGLIAAAQRVEHYEIAGYGTVRTYAQTLGRTQDANLLQQTLDEEGQTDHKLSALAERLINPEAE